MEQDQLTNINSKLDLLLKVISRTIVENKSYDDKIIFFSELGFTDNMIAEIIGVKPVSVRARKSTLKKQKKKK